MSRYSVEIFESYVIEPGIPTISFTLVDLTFINSLNFCYLGSPMGKLKNEIPGLTNARAKP